MVKSVVSKARTAYVCGECGADYTKWQGQCAECGAWNTLSEIVLERATAASVPAAARRDGWAGKAETPKITALKDVEQRDQARVSTGIGEFDRVLGGGLVEGAVVLIGGDPGIGKSTLLLQALAKMASTLPVLYVTGEESLAQVAGRAVRLDLPLDGLNALAETGIEHILQHASAARPKLMVADSVQTLWTEALSAAPGSVSQVRESAARLVRYAKETGTAVFLVGHVTKEGGIAGPRVLEHMVDAVLYFEGESGSRFRLLRAFKNRFGAVNELGVFAMGEKGLKEVSNPSAIFLSGGSAHQPGSCVMVTREGTRPLMVEVQALVDTSPLSNPRRVAVGLEQNRLAMLLAVLHRHGGIVVGDQDVFVNVVGGIRVQETAADLPVLLAVLSSLRDRPLAEKTIAFGEVGLSGEIRPVPNGEDRLREAATHGFKRAIVSKANAPKIGTVKGMEVIAVERLAQALEAASA
ncbi:DNA repair protein RadA [Xanthomonas albilineans]|uniref:DNA repair protein RadA n=1 Tax=Xanthomonas albilineans (strain GPE PC73 / CFBP 7063) TaxID=380358 RepID=D2UD19_XANAP|nr:DNA repair protein RadA [Xanthomonas albilineans]QHQ27663.1 putative DNA repair protein rada [Xanthomonas albilineans]CBA15452.1 probable dna repair protein rada homolog (dna repair protein sms homolog) [Xanthomonas albilineans GPE PC73]